MSHGLCEFVRETVARLEMRGVFKKSNCCELQVRSCVVVPYRKHIRKIYKLIRIGKILEGIERAYFTEV
jgi:hypothetical protein